MQKAPLTYCDPGNPNGVAVATVNGNVIGYTFDWYEGSATNSIYTGSEAGISKSQHLRCKSDRCYFRLCGYIEYYDRK